MKHFIDCGANIGQTFDWYLLKTNEYDGCHIWCIEPSVRNLDALRLRCLAVMADNTHNFAITICPFALSDRTGFTKMFEKHQDSLGDSLLETTYAGEALIPNKETPVEMMCGVIDAAEFIRAAIPEGDLAVLKIDTEGSEVQILDSILSPGCARRIENILVEFHTDTLDQKERLRLRLKELAIPMEDWTF